MAIPETLTRTGAGYLDTAETFFLYDLVDHYLNVLKIPLNLLKM